MRGEVGYRDAPFSLNVITTTWTLFQQTWHGKDMFTLPWQAPKGYKCEVCGKEGFINSTTLNNHKRIKHSSDRPHNCEYCPARFATSMSLSSHRASKHGLNARGEKVVKKMFPCTLCTKVLTTSIKLKQHIEVR